MGEDLDAQSVLFGEFHSLEWALPPDKTAAAHFVKFRDASGVHCLCGKTLRASTEVHAGLQSWVTHAGR
eukprot:2985889-Karenia_brevis.AAC.1